MLYGFMRGDLVIIAANAVSLGLLGGIIFFKLRHPAAPRGSPTRAAPAKY
jgi:hypothetical protein